MNWKTSSYSGPNGGTCVEAQGRWHISSHSGSMETCVEASVAPAMVRVRDSKDRARAIVTVSADAWTEFLAGLTE